MTDTNNPPEVIIELDLATAKFLLNNCEVNINFGLAHLQTVSRATAEVLIEQMEAFKIVRAAVQKGMRDD